jgi:four helix bundle protein
LKDFKNLAVWQKCHSLSLGIYRLTADFPKEEMFGLTSQIRRACSSISANIAEGCGRDGDADFGRFLQIAMGSAVELENHLLLAHDLKMLEDLTFENLNSQLTSVKKMLISLIKKVKAYKTASSYTP